MAIKIIADVHGAYDSLATQLDPGDTAILLGDYLNLVDFRTFGGILSEVYTREEISSALSALARGNSELAKRSVQEIAGGNEEKHRRVRRLMEEAYGAFFESLPCRSFVIYGNTDSLEMMRAQVSGDVEIVEAGVIEVEGQRFGLVSGNPRGPWNVGLPGEMEPEAYDALVASLGPVDVLCTHCPPAIPELTWDRLANRDEFGSTALVEYLDRFEPLRHYFGHVHNPRVSSLVRGKTRVMNAGFFRERHTVVIHTGTVTRRGQTLES